VTFVCTFGNV